MNIRTLISFVILFTFTNTLFSCKKSSNHKDEQTSQDSIAELMVGEWSITCLSTTYNGQQAAYDTTVFNRWIPREGNGPQMLFYNHNDSLFYAQIDVNMPAGSKIYYFGSNGYSMPLTTNDTFLGYGDSLYNRKNNLVFAKDGTITFYNLYDYKQVDYEKSTAKKLVYAIQNGIAYGRSGKWNYSSTTGKLTYNIDHGNNEIETHEYAVQKVSDRNILFINATVANGWTAFSYMRLEH